MGFSLYWKQKEVSLETFKRFQHVLKGFLKHTVFTKADDNFLVLQTHNEEDECERFITERIPLCANYSCKTKYLPYTADVATALILMMEFGIATEISADEDEYLKDALKDVQGVYPLVKQKEIQDFLIREEEEEVEPPHCRTCYCGH